MADFTNFPKPGDTNISGFVEWVSFIPSNGQFVGIVSALIADYATPPSLDQGGFTNPLLFEFSSDIELVGGQSVRFDVAQGNFAPYAVNVTAA